MSTTTPPTKTITAQCLCRAHSFSTTVPISDLPLAATACHCNSCRHVTGALYSIDVPWPQPSSAVDTSKLERYKFTEKLHVRFCGTCSSPMFFENISNDKLGAFTGVLPNDEGLVKILDNIFVGDTKDGGASMWLRKCNADGAEIPRFKESDSSEEFPYDWPPASEFAGTYENTNVKSIKGRCHCRGVQFELRRGDYDDRTKEDLPWYVDPKTRKNLASSECCNTCRISFGVDIINWTFAELKYFSFDKAAQNLAFQNISELKKAVDEGNPGVGTMARYQSSAEVERYFCSKCSACVFYTVSDRPEMVDLASGLLESSEGARAEDFLSWSFGKVGWNKDAEGGWREGMVRFAEAESEEWRKERGYPVNWRRVEQA